MILQAARISRYLLVCAACKGGLVKNFLTKTLSWSLDGGCTCKFGTVIHAWCVDDHDMHIDIQEVVSKQEHPCENGAGKSRQCHMEMRVG